MCTTMCVALSYPHLCSCPCSCLCPRPVPIPVPHPPTSSKCAEEMARCTQTCALCHLSSILALSLAHPALSVQKGQQDVRERACCTVSPRLRSRALSPSPSSTRACGRDGTTRATVHVAPSLPCSCPRPVPVPPHSPAPSAQKRRNNAHVCMHHAISPPFSPLPSPSSTHRA